MNVSEIVALALAEDIGPGDITSQVSIPEEARANGAIVAKADGVLAGIAVAEECFRQVDERVRLEALLQDGEVFRAGAELAKVLGPARSLLAGERVALNFLQRLCGTATLTRAFVNRIKGTKARIVDTRKTTPGLRALEKLSLIHISEPTN